MCEGVPGDSANRTAQPQQSPLVALPRKRAVEVPFVESQPKRLRRRFTPRKKLYALAFAKFLRDRKTFADALQAAADYEQSEMECLPNQRNKEDPSKDTLDRSRARIDVVSMLLQRRVFHDARQKGAILAIHVYSDASPILGEELQGMVLDICWKSGAVSRTILPGSCIRYGLGSATMKGIYWLCCLVRRPHQTSAMQSLCSCCHRVTNSPKRSRVACLAVEESSAVRVRKASWPSQRAGSSQLGRVDRDSVGGFSSRRAWAGRPGVFLQPCSLLYNGSWG